jgi:hypothetical protein
VNSAMIFQRTRPKAPALCCCRQNSGDLHSAVDSYFSTDKGQSSFSLQ